jgi:hypothetical protein
VATAAGVQRKKRLVVKAVSFRSRALAKTIEQDAAAVEIGWRSDKEGCRVLKFYRQWSERFSGKRVSRRCKIGVEHESSRPKTEEAEKIGRIAADGASLVPRVCTKRINTYKRMIGTERQVEGVEVGGTRQQSPTSGGAGSKRKRERKKEVKDWAHRARSQPN